MPLFSKKNPSQPRPGRKRLITGLDIGTTKVCAIIAEVDSEGLITVLGLGSSPSRGVRRGMVTDIDLTVEAIQSAIESAYQSAQVMPPELLIGIAGDHISGLNAGALIDVRHGNMGIDENDIRTVRKKALQMLGQSLAPDQEKIYDLVREFIVGDEPGIANPLGLSAQRLEVRLHVITASRAAVTNFLRCVKKSGYKTSGIVLQSVASALAILSKEEMETGVVLVDIGGGTTDIAIFANGGLQHTAEVGRGGDMVTQDIHAMLKCTLHDAENLKKNQGQADSGEINPELQFEVPGPGRGARRITYTRKGLSEIIEARIEEILEAVKKVVEHAEMQDKVHSGVVLTGGTALLEGIEIVAARILDFAPTVRVGMPEGLLGFGDVANSPIYSTAVGLIKWAAVEGPGYQRDSWCKRKIKELIDIYV